MSTPRNRASLEQILRRVVEINDKVMAIESKGKKLTQKERVAIIDELKLIIQAIRDFLELKVTTSILGNEQAPYVTTVKVGGDVESKFPKELNTVIFNRHNELVNSAWEFRKTILLKIIDAIIELLKNL
jgi:Ribonuclease G/E